MGIESKALEKSNNVRSVFHLRSRFRTSPFRVRISFDSQENPFYGSHAEDMKAVSALSIVTYVGIYYMFEGLSKNTCERDRLIVREI